MLTDVSGERNLAAVIEHGNAVLDRMQTRWPAKVAVRRPRPTTAVYASYPYYFVDAFPSAEERDVRRLAVALRLVADSVCVTDVVCDYATGARVTYDVMTVQALQFEAYGVLYRLFRPGADFWTLFQRDMAEWMEACIREADLIKQRSGWPEVVDEVLSDIAKGKAALAKAVVTGLAGLSGDISHREQLRRSVEQCHQGVQLLDDLQDWREDLKRGVPTQVVMALVSARPDLAARRSDQETLDAFARELHYNGHAERATELVLARLDEAARLTDGIKVEPWRQRIARCRKRCERLARDLGAIADANLKRGSAACTVPAEPPQAHYECDRDVVDALSFLLQQERMNFGEARHLLAYPWEFDPYGECDEQVCDVYQRALVTVALGDAACVMPEVVQPVVAREVEYLVGACEEGEVRGWSYFPGVAELPASADVSAQVMIALHPNRGCDKRITACIGDAKQELLERCARPDGSFLNWIVSESAHRSEETAEVLGLSREWMMAIDVEVAATVAYALSICCPGELSDLVRQTARWVVAQQRPDGSWRGRGVYTRRAYSTYVCTRLLCEVWPYSPALQRAFEFVRTSQGVDGLWGGAGERDEAGFDSALSLLTLALAWESDHVRDADRICIRRGAKAIRMLRNADGAWRPATFLQVGRAEYGSSTVTTAFVLRALLQCTARLEQ